MDLNALLGEPDVFLSIFNPLYFIEELGNDGRNPLERCLPNLPPEKVLEQLPADLALALKGENFLSPKTYLKNKRAGARNLEDNILYKAAYSMERFSFRSVLSNCFTPPPPFQEYFIEI